ncbi:MAG: outer membrane beta-barrel protein [Saprospiraceae bacterium]
MTQVKNKVLIALMLLCSVAAFSQTEISEKKSKYGIYMGVNHSNLAIKEMPTNATTSTDFGFQLGILADFSIKDWLSFSPKAELSFNTANVDIDYGIGFTSYEIMPVNVGLMTHFKLKVPNNNFEPYFLFGPHYRLSLTEKTTTSAEFPTYSALSFDIGIGTEKIFKHFAFAPELRYSHGLGDVNGNPTLQSIKYHNISLIFNFLG